MKGQLAIEFMLVFLLTLSVTAVMTVALLGERMEAGRLAASYSAVNRAESAARAEEAALRCGADTATPLAHRTELDRFRVEEGGRTIEIGGAFIDDPDEPA